MDAWLSKSSLLLGACFLLAVPPGWSRAAACPAAAPTPPMQREDLLAAREAVALRTQLLESDDPELARAHTVLGQTAAALHLLPEAEAAFRNALSTYERALGRHLYVAIAQNNLASLLETRGRHAEAEALYRRSLALKRSLLPAGDPAIATGLSNLSVLLEKLGRYVEAEVMATEALRIDQAVLAPDAAQLAIDLNNLANVLAATGRLGEAEDRYRRALRIHADRPCAPSPLQATTFSNLAELYRVMSRHEEAEALLDAALKQAGTGTTRAIALNNLGLLYAETGRAQQAEAQFREALLLFTDTLGETHGYTANSHRNLGQLLARSGRREEAEAQLRTAYQLVLLSGEAEFTWKVQDALRAFFARSEPGLAIFFGKRAVNGLQQLRGQFWGRESLQRNYTRQINAVYQGLAELLIASGRLAEAQQVLTMLREQEYFDFIRRDRHNDPRQTQATYSGAETGWEHRHQAAQAALVRIGREYRALSAIDPPLRSAAQQDRYLQLQDELGAARAAFAAYLDQLHAAFRAQPASRAMALGEKQLRSLRAVQAQLRRLPQRTGLIHYLVSPDGLHILLTTPEVQLAGHSPIPAQALNGMVFSHRERLVDPRRNPQPTGTALYQAMLAPIEEALQRGELSTLLVSLDGALRYLPMGALHDGEAWLAERYALAVYTPATRSTLAQPAAPHWRIAGLGVSERAEGFDALPAVPFELGEIVRDEGDPADPGVLPGEIHLDRQFSPQTLTTVLEQGFPVVHIASHFHFQPGTEADSFLLTGANRRLSLAEFRNGAFPLFGVDLLTLSACQTAVSGYAQADGREIEGLGAMAQSQGARSVMATLWPVADASTALLMRQFYAARQSGKLSKAEALREAQKALLHGEIGLDQVPEELVRGAATRSGNGGFPIDYERPFAHPFFWAPFILMGDPV